MNARVDASAKFKVRLTVNGEQREFAVDPWRTLLGVLVEDFRLAKTKEGCSIGECGACTVAMDSKLVSSCLVLAVDADGKDIVTMEKLTAGESRFNPLMEAFIHPDEGARRAVRADQGPFHDSGGSGSQGPPALSPEEGRSEGRKPMATHLLGRGPGHHR